MTITSHQIHNVLRTYGKQLRRGLRLNRIKQADTSQPVDTIKISPEAKRAMVVERVAADILGRLADRSTGNTDVEQKVMDLLIKEYGRPVSLEFDEDKGRFEFNLLDSESGSVIETLAGEEADKLNSLLAQIAEQVVDQTMLKG
ncbi:MAG: DVU0524 family FlgM-associated protein [Thermodesulfobacteriota bacterium]